MYAYSDDYSILVNLISVVIRLGLWGVLGYVMGKKAKDVGLSFGAHFALTFFLGLIGIIISLVKINSRKKDIAIRNMQMQQGMYGNPYAQNPYQQNVNPYQQNVNPYQQNANPYQQGSSPYQNGAQNPYQGGVQNTYQQQGTSQYQQYQQGAQPYQQQPTQQQTAASYGAQQSFDSAEAPSSPFGASFTCNECGNVQNVGGFCKVCGSKL